MAYFISYPIWETVSKLKSDSSSRVITFTPAHSHIQITSHSLYTTRRWYPYESRPSYLANILVISEIWLSLYDTTSCISDICPTHSSFCLQPHHFRCGGCVGSVVSNKFKVTSRFLDFSLSALTCLTVLLLVTSYIFMTLLE